MAVVPAHRVLPDVHIAVHAPLLSFYAHLFRVCQTSLAQTWSRQGIVACRLAYSPLQPLGWFRLRPRTLVPAFNTTRGYSQPHFELSESLFFAKDFADFGKMLIFAPSSLKQ